jgi:hypothetical protein
LLEIKEEIKMVSELFKRFVGSADGYEVRTQVSSSLPPNKPPTKTLVGSQGNDNDGMYLKIVGGKVIGWESIN